MDHQERNRQLLADYAAGMTLAAVGDRYGISPERVRQIVARHGMTRDRDAERDALDAQVAALSDGTRTAGDIAGLLCVGKSTIRNARRRHEQRTGTKLPRGPHPPRPYGQSPKLRRIAELTRQGWMVKAIAAELGTTPAAVSVARSRLRNKGILEGHNEVRYV